MLAVGISTAFFFLVWGILHDGGDEMPWVTAGIGAGTLLCGAAVLREVFIVRARRRLLRQERLLDERRRSIHNEGVDSRSSSKLSLEMNAAILSEIRRKSEAAEVLKMLSAGHREVFDLCREYLSRNENELKTVSARSPRLTALLKGRSAASDYHRYHLLQWAEIETRTLTGVARGKTTTDEKIEAAHNALSVLDSALESYPAEQRLLQSRELLLEMLVSAEVSHWIGQAERCVLDGDYAGARRLYREALIYLGHDNVQSQGRDQAAAHINSAIERLDLIST